jgi:hypothetical protein
LTARSTSSSPEDGACATVSPVAGFTTSSVRPSTGSTGSPPMKFRSVPISVVAAIPVGLLVLRARK